MKRALYNSGGTCWEDIDHTTNLCKKAFRLNMTYDECCGIQGLGSVSWTPHDVTNTIFYWNFLSKGASMCQRCHKTCSSVVCEQGKTCRMVNGVPVCVCRPHCYKTLKSRGALCGTDGLKYRNYCALQRYNCIAEQQISVEYYGKCRNSCRRVQCERGKHCLQDQNGVPHCVPCHDYCNMILPDNPEYHMCGENGKIYRNTCELRADICKTGRSIRVAHSGKCADNETCKTVTCPQGTTCLVSAKSGNPVCMNCAALCVQTVSVPICGTDKRTYHSYCHMVMSGCKSGVFVSTHHRGPCKQHPKRRELSKVQLESRNGFKLRQMSTSTTERQQKRHRNGRHRRQNNRNKRHKHKERKHHSVVPYKTFILSNKKNNTRRRNIYEEESNSS
ncbi:follistatin-A-like isoform X2 [Mercenaria mercenaria]|uniref:follistatin-A-like isoform X2 n=1 Tax=Mercenaria mercenaria TaxID=6596 RepID=UPI00234EF173|nr:follistatin-A-like isoform X2 [Mercenaria mercenaria]